MSNVLAQGQFELWMCSWKIGTMVVPRPHSEVSPLSFVLVFSLAFLSCLFEFHAFLRWTPVVTRLPSCFTPRCSSGSSPASTPASSQRAPAARSTFWIYLASKTSPTTHLSRFFAAPACCSFAQRYDVIHVRRSCALTMPTRSCTRCSSTRCSRLSRLSFIMRLLLL